MSETIFDTIILNNKLAEMNARIVRLMSYDDPFLYIYRCDGLNKTITKQDKEIEVCIKEIKELSIKLVKLDKQTKIIEDLKLELEEAKASLSKIMTKSVQAPDHILINWDDNEDGCRPSEDKEETDVGKFFDKSSATEYIRIDLYETKISSLQVLEDKKNSCDYCKKKGL